jgi:hypothetical protein
VPICWSLERAPSDLEKRQHPHNKVNGQKGRADLLASANPAQSEPLGARPWRRRLLSSNIDTPGWRPLARRLGVGEYPGKSWFRKCCVGFTVPGGSWGLGVSTLHRSSVASRVDVRSSHECQRRTALMSVVVQSRHKSGVSARIPDASSDVLPRALASALAAYGFTTTTEGTAQRLPASITRTEPAQPPEYPSGCFAVTECEQFVLAGLLESHCAEEIANAAFVSISTGHPPL